MCLPCRDAPENKFRSQTYCPNVPHLGRSSDSKVQRVQCYFGGNMSNLCKSTNMHYASQVQYMQTQGVASPETRDR